MDSGVVVDFAHLGVTYANGVVALSDLSLTIAADQAVCVVGPSGCGKTTLLRVLAGLERATHGGVQLSRPATLAMVFQQGLLFPWLSVADNISYGLMTRGATPPQCRAAAREWCERMGLQRFIDAYPHQLSGGMQQRVGLARALAVNPDVLLLDEPFAALDAQTRVLMQELLVDLRRQGLCRSLLLVTHAIDEALLVGDRVVVLSARPGRSIADMTPQVSHSQSFDEIRAQPAFMQAFTTIWQLIRGEVEAQLREEVTL